MKNANHALALLKGLADDYANVLKAQGSLATSASVAGIAKEAADDISMSLRAYEELQKKSRTASERDTEILPQPITAESSP